MAGPLITSIGASIGTSETEMKLKKEVEILNGELSDVIATNKDLSTALDAARLEIQGLGRTFRDGSIVWEGVGGPNFVEVQLEEGDFILDAPTDGKVEMRGALKGPSTNIDALPEGGWTDIDALPRFHSGALVERFMPRDHASLTPKQLEELYPMRYAIGDKEVTKAEYDAFPDVSVTVGHPVEATEAELRKHCTGLERRAQRVSVAYEALREKLTAENLVCTGCEDCCIGELQRQLPDNDNPGCDFDIHWQAELGVLGCAIEGRVEPKDEGEVYDLDGIVRALEGAGKGQCMKLDSHSMMYRHEQGGEE